MFCAVSFCEGKTKVEFCAVIASPEHINGKSDVAFPPPVDLLFLYQNLHPFPFIFLPVEHPPHMYVSLSAISIILFIRFERHPQYVPFSPGILLSSLLPFFEILLLPVPSPSRGLVPYVISLSTVFYSSFPVFLQL